MKLIKKITLYACALCQSVAVLRAKNQIMRTLEIKIDKGTRVDVAKEIPEGPQSPLKTHLILLWH